MGLDMKYDHCIKTSLPEGVGRRFGKTFIYIFRHPQTFEIRYVGKAKDPQARYWAHMKPYNRAKKFPVSRWTNKLFIDGFYPVMELIECTDNLCYEERERYWIARYRAEGYRLLNITDGGEGRVGAIISDEVRQKTSKTLMGHTVSLETRQMLREAQTGRKLGHETLQRVGEASKRAWASLTPEGRAERVKGLGADYERTPEIRAKTGATKRMKRSKEGVSKHLGVTFDTKSGAWTACINGGSVGQRIHLGSYRTEAGAASAFNRKAKEIYGDQATLNDVEDVDDPRLERKSGSKYHGVGWSARKEKWVVRLKKDGKNVHGGFFFDEQIAAMAYDAKACELGLEVAKNFP